MSFTSVLPVAPPVDRWRDVHLAAVARGVSFAGDFVAATALLLALQQRGAGGYVVAGLLLAAAVPMIVMAPIGGRLADRYDSRLLLTAVGLAQAICCTAMVFVTSSAGLIALTAVLSTGFAITGPTLGALVPDMVSPERLPRALAITQTANSAGLMLAPALAGLLFGAFGLRVPLLLDAVSYLAIVLVGLALRTRRNGPGAARPTVGDDVRPVGAWRLRDDRLLAYLIPAVALVVCVISTVNVVAVFFVRGTLGASAGAYGLLDTVWTAAMLGGAWLLSRSPGSDRRLTVLMLANLAVTGTVLLAGAAVPHIGWLVGVYLIGGLCNGAENTIAQLLIARRVPGTDRGRALGLMAGAMNAANTIGYAVAAPLLDLLGARGSIAAAGLAGVVVVAALTGPVLRGATAKTG